MPLVISHSFTEPDASFTKSYSSVTKITEKGYANMHGIIKSLQNTMVTFVSTCLLLLKTSCCTIAGVPKIVKVGSLYTGTYKH